MPRFKIYAGLSGGFGGAQYHGIYEYHDEEEAMMAARELAIEEYHSYGGNHGLYTWESMKETLAEDEYDGDESQVSDDEVDYRLLEDIEGWITYRVRELPAWYVSTPSDDDEDDDPDTLFYNLS